MVVAVVCFGVCGCYRGYCCCYCGGGGGRGVLILGVIGGINVVW